MQPMKGLLVTAFKGDPELESLEPQVFDDPMNGKEMRFLRYRLARVENRVEVELGVMEHGKPNNLPLGMNMLTPLMRMLRTDSLRCGCSWATWQAQTHRGLVIMHQTAVMV